jgi:hypothetical protein
MKLGVVVLNEQPNRRNTRDVESHYKNDSIFSLRKCRYEARQDPFDRLYIKASRGDWMAMEHFSQVRTVP